MSHAWVRTWGVPYSSTDQLSSGLGGSGTCATPGYGPQGYRTPVQTNYRRDWTPSPSPDGRSYTPGVGVGFETPIKKDGYDSDQDRDTELIRRRETDGYESRQGGKTPSPYGQDDDGRLYIPGVGVGVGFETPLQRSGYDSEQDRDTDFIRRRETGGYESGQSH